MKLITVLLASFVTFAAEGKGDCPWYRCEESLPPQNSTVIMSCAGRTYTNTDAIHLAAIEEADGSLQANIRATTGENEIVPLKRRDNALVAIDPNKFFHIFLAQDGVANRVLVMWRSKVLKNQYMGLRMTCSDGET